MRPIVPPPRSTPLTEPKPTVRGVVAFLAVLLGPPALLAGDAVAVAVAALALAGVAVT